MPGEPAGATYVELEGTRVRYEDVGEGPAVVLVHGFASSLETWLTVAPVLEKAHRVISLDLKGFGWTDRPEGDYSPAGQAALVFALMDHLGVEKAAVVGHSWGASVVLRMALEKPERVTRLALYDAWVYEEQVPAFFLWARVGGLGEALFRAFYDERPADKMGNAFFDKSLMNEALVEDVERALERPGTKAAALAAVRGQVYAEVQRRYRALKQPALLLWGEQDRVTPVTVGERLHLDLPNSQLVRFPRCGHFPMLEAAPQSTAVLQRFLAEGQP
jgi:pimeloyl-ACP methyl ester carboxylesterase